MAATSVRPLCPELATIARLELNETPKKLEDGIQHLKEWIAKQPHLRARTDDQWLATFLRGCKHSLEKAKEKLDLHYTMRSIAPDMFQVNIWDPKFDEIMKSGTHLVLPKGKNPADLTVYITRISLFDPERFQPQDLFSLTRTLLEITFMEDDHFVVAGFVQILDLNGLSLNHLTLLTAAHLRKLIMFNQDASPIRLRAMHIIGMPSFGQVTFNIMKQFLSEKNRQKIHVHKGGFEELHKYISTDILPEEYGGKGGTFQDVTDHFVNKVAEYNTYFKDDLQYGTDETKRPGKPRTVESVFGIDGSFRQLDID